ncbi:unnamed protein product [Acanthoscelides obtectus]|uniref:Uncharacterized protein n=1 Tax=Acanthoscelides obtectus TaxID=200917 RepID=A0A9P0KHG7_ACAOB|nr:unnamed protein product [Acanthoscelides obtectus]CAK1632426.1 hypothetical protein AOBTE_LOCUS7556 [Acanthoscelides obtectus]
MANNGDNFTLLIICDFMSAAMSSIIRLTHGFINSSPILSGFFCFAIIKAISNEALRCCDTPV